MADWGQVRYLISGENVFHIEGYFLLIEWETHFCVDKRQNWNAARLIYLGFGWNRDARAHDFCTFENITFLLLY